MRREETQLKYTYGFSSVYVAAKLFSRSMTLFIGTYTSMTRIHKGSVKQFMHAIITFIRLGRMCPVITVGLVSSGRLRKETH